jgi:hypothetical protein
MINARQINGDTPDPVTNVLVTNVSRRRAGRLAERRISGGKGGNLESLGNRGLADEVAKRRKLSETRFWDPTAVGKYSWGGCVKPPIR